MPKGKNNKLDTGLGNLTWGLLPIGFQGVMIIPKDFKEKA
jgi:hypothetical protein|tara:strand:- start:387 stop:506 length:120 start_codon:yes stop_codon:yes gene_type:complete